MSKILYSQSTQTTKPYPRKDDEPIVGLDPDYLVLTQVQTESPTYDPETQTVSSQYVVDTEALEYRQGWTITDIPPQPQWDGFNRAMLADTVFNQTIGTVMTTAPATALAIPAALAQVSSNGVNAFAQVFNAFCTAGSVSSQQRGAWAVIAENFNLPAEFVSLIVG